MKEIDSLHIASTNTMFDKESLDINRYNTDSVYKARVKKEVAKGIEEGSDLLTLLDELQDEYDSLETELKKYK